MQLDNVLKLVFSMNRLCHILVIVLLISCDLVVTADTFGQGGSTSTFDGSTLFVPSLDVNSPTAFSAVDAARRNRPPEPTKTREDLFYPDGFLTLSSAAADIVPNGKATDHVESVETVPTLDPSVETTPLVAKSLSEQKMGDEAKDRDQFYFFAISLALAGLGVFVYHEYRYRDQLRSDLVKNARLCSPSAVSSDFDSLLAADVDLKDPHAPSYTNPHFGVDAGLYHDLELRDMSSVGDVDVSNDSLPLKLSHLGADLGAENFDFTPESKSDISNNEVDEEFVVDDNSVVLPHWSGSSTSDDH